MGRQQVTIYTCDICGRECEKSEINICDKCGQDGCTAHTLWASISLHITNITPDRTLYSKVFCTKCEIDYEKELLEPLKAAQQEKKFTVQQVE